MRGRVRSGCLSLVLRVGVVSVAAVFAALSVALLIAFAVSALGQPEGTERIFKVLVASAAGLAFFVVGRGIWRDLRPGRPAAQPEEERGSAEDGER
ncbi:MAG: hypothetical protein M3P49_01110 [Actinomycetota bacterium]|nr:hypothetical protein [Actinomycetota bacterium]